MDRKTLEATRALLCFLLRMSRAEGQKADLNRKAVGCEYNNCCPQQIHRELCYEQYLEVAIQVIEEHLSQVTAESDE